MSCLCCSGDFNLLLQHNGCIQAVRVITRRGPNQGSDSLQTGPWAYRHAFRLNSEMTPSHSSHWSKMFILSYIIPSPQSAPLLIASKSLVCLPLLPSTNISTHLTWCLPASAIPWGSWLSLHMCYFWGHGLSQKREWSHQAGWENLWPGIWKFSHPFGTSALSGAHLNKPMRERAGQ